MVVRRMMPADVDAVRALPGAASALVGVLRGSDAWLPALSFVAEGPDGDVVGHVMATRGSVGAAPAVALAPPTVHPDRQGHGVGLALMHSVLGAADATGESLVAVVASPPGYFARFGFRPPSELGIIAPMPGWEPYFVVRPLTGYEPSHRGGFVYPAEFHRAG